MFFFSNYSPKLPSHPLKQLRHLQVNKHQPAEAISTTTLWFWGMWLGYSSLTFESGNYSTSILPALSKTPCTVQTSPGWKALIASRYAFSQFLGSRKFKAFPLDSTFQKYREKREGKVRICFPTFQDIIFRNQLHLGATSPSFGVMCNPDSAFGSFPDFGKNSNLGA